MKWRILCREWWSNIFFNIRKHSSDTWCHWGTQIATRETTLITCKKRRSSFLLSCKNNKLVSTMWELKGNWASYGTYPLNVLSRISKMRQQLDNECYCKSEIRCCVFWSCPISGQVKETSAIGWHSVMVHVVYLMSVSTGLIRIMSI